MEARKNSQKAKGTILGTCPDCRGTGTIPREAPLLANLKDPAIRAYQAKLRSCPRCNGIGQLGVG